MKPNTASHISKCLAKAEVYQTADLMRVLGLSVVMFVFI